MGSQNLKTAIREHQQRTGSNYTTARREVLSPDHDTTAAPFMSQASSTTDPGVLEALADIDLLKRHFHFLRADFVRRATGQTNFFARNSMSASGIHEITAVGGDEKPGGEMGRWKNHDSGGFVPAKNSKMYAEFEALNHVPSVPVPGAEQVDCLIVGNFLISPTMFVLDGRAWMWFSRDLEPLVSQLRAQDRIGVNWRRERNSDAIRAVEDWNARHAGAPLRPLEDAEKDRVELLFATAAERKKARAEAFAALMRPTTA